jgi:hypothetical protein
VYYWNDPSWTYPQMADDSATQNYVRRLHAMRLDGRWDELHAELLRPSVLTMLDVSAPELLLVSWVSLGEAMGFDPVVAYDKMVSGDLADSGWIKALCRAWLLIGHADAAARLSGRAVALYRSSGDSQGLLKLSFYARTLSVSEGASLDVDKRAVIAATLAEHRALAFQFNDLNALANSLALAVDLDLLEHRIDDCAPLLEEMRA